MTTTKRRDVTTAPDSAAITGLVMFGETVFTGAGEIAPILFGDFVLTITGKRPKTYTTAAPAVRALRRASA